MQVVNKTGAECILQSYKVTKGHLIFVVPNDTFIAPGANQTFWVQQNLAHGPTIITNYLCGGKKVSFESHQNFCVLNAGKIRGTVLSHDPQLNLRFTSTPGYYYWSYPGHIYWALSDNPE